MTLSKRQAGKLILLCLFLIPIVSAVAEDAIVRSPTNPQSESSGYSETKDEPSALSDSTGNAGGVLERMLSLKDAERLALLNDATVLSAEQDKIVAAERVKEAGYLFLPEFGVQASATKYNALYPFALPAAGNALLFPKNTANLGNNLNDIMFGGAYMNMNLYEGGRGINTLKLAQAAQRQAETNYDSARMDVILSVKRVFYRLLLAQKKSQLAKDYLSDVERLSQDGNLDVWEQMEVESRRAEAEIIFAKDVHKLKIEQLQFLKSLNLELDTPFKIVGDIETNPVSIDVEKIILWALELRPELQSETYKAQMDAISVNLAQSRRTPTVFISGDYDLMTQNFPVDKNNWDATIGLKLPFAYDYWSELMKKRAQQRQGDIKRSELQDQVRLEVRQTYANVVFWQKEYPLRESQYLRIKRLYERASRASGHTVLKLHAVAGIFDLEISYLKAVTQHILAKAELERAVGREIDP
jgi:outer membrane protein TolC